MIKRYCVSCEESGIEVVLDVDHDVLTRDLAEEINRFWTNAELRLDRADGDVVKAVIRLAAQAFFFVLIEDLPGCVRAAMRAFHDLEGWPKESGITLVSFDGLPEFDSIDLSVTEVSR